jgi:hypothetical protein
MIQDYLQSRLVYYLTNLHIKPRSIWLSRHGESEFNLSGQIGGDANLSERGERYAKLLPELVERSGLPKDAPLTIWTSTLKRTSQTAKYLVEELGWEKLQWKALDELDSGVCDGMTVSILLSFIPRFSFLTSEHSIKRFRSNILRISKPVMTTSTTIAIVEASRIVMWSFVSNLSSWNWSEARTLSSSRKASTSPLPS